MQIDEVQMESMLLDLFLLHVDYRDNHDDQRKALNSGNAKIDGDLAFEARPSSCRIGGPQSA